MQRSTYQELLSLWRGHLANKSYTSEDVTVVRRENKKNVAYVVIEDLMNVFVAYENVILL